MENNYSISVRTEDTGDQPFPFALVTKPKDTICVRNAEYGYVAFTLDAPGKQLNETGVKGGLNTAGLSCDKQTLIDSVYPNRTAGLDNIDASLICQWALEGFGSVADLKEGLKKVAGVRACMRTGVRACARAQGRQANGWAHAC